MESAGIPAELIEYAYKLVDIKEKATNNLGQHLETNQTGKKRTCTKRDRQLTHQAFAKLEAEGTQDSDIGESLIGTKNLGEPSRTTLAKGLTTIKDIVELGEKMFCYMQEDLPEILQQTNKTQEVDTAQQLKEMQKNSGKQKV